MIVQYCDLCGSPLKESEFYRLYIASPNNINQYRQEDATYEDYMRYLQRIEKEVKEICPSCKIIFDKIFEYRLQGMSKLTDECAGMFNLPPKIDKKKKDIEGNK